MTEQPDQRMTPRTFDIYAYIDGVRGDYIAFANDSVSGATIAAALFSTRMQMRAGVEYGVGVVDNSTDLLVSFIGYKAAEV